ncbi:MAG: Uma2 family endonuclease [Pyrinomonadaceae bacterium]|nr:Uma2 family endonuclease [Pyrinomonadaceae bacterium]
MTAEPKRKYTLEEYFELDKNAEGNFEYFDGEIFEMSGVSPEHATIEMNLAEILNPVARKRGCRAFPANLRIKVPVLPTYRYPDLSVAYGETVFVEIQGLQCLVNPILIVEVLSESTEFYDRGEKFRQYKSIESFREYLLVSQTEKIITLFQKHNERFWLQGDYVAGESFHLNTLDFDLTVDEIYQDVEIKPPTYDTHNFK